MPEGYTTNYLASWHTTHQVVEPGVTLDLSIRVFSFEGETKRVEIFLGKILEGNKIEDIFKGSLEELVHILEEA